MKKIMRIGLVLILIVSITGCQAVSTSDKVQQEKMEQLMNEAENRVGMPNIKNYYERKMAKEIFELRDRSDLICYAYTRIEMTGKYVYEGRCMGYGLPYSTQYTNPEKPLYKDYHDSTIVPQADPNGLFSATGLSATWLMMINEETGESEVMYCEPNIIVTQSKKPRRYCEEWSLPENY